MHISPTPRPGSSSTQQCSEHVIDELLTQYQINKQQQIPDPADALILWIKDSIYDDRFKDAFSEQEESARAGLFKQLTSVFLNENVNDDEIWTEISRGWRTVPSIDRAPVLCHIVQVLGVPKPGQQQLWQWVWQELSSGSSCSENDALLLKIAESLLANDQIGMLEKIMNAELKIMAYSGRNFSPAMNLFCLSRIGASFWPQLLSVIRQIPKQNTSLLPIMDCVGTLLNNLRIDDPAIWKTFSAIMISIEKPGIDDIEKFIDIGRQVIKDPEFWNWIIALIPTIDIHERYRIATEVVSAMGNVAVKTPKNWTRMLDLLDTLPVGSMYAVERNKLLGKIITNMGRTLLTSPALWNKVMDEITLNPGSWHSAADWGLEELTNQMYSAKVTNPNLSFRLIKLHAMALFQYRQDKANMNFHGLMKEIEGCTDISTLVNMLLRQALPDDDKSRLLQQLSRSMGHAIDDMALWTSVITHQVQAISYAAPCPDFVALKYHVTDLCAHYRLSGPTFELIMKNAIERGRWQLSEFEQVRQFRQEVQAAAPHFPWEKLFNAEARLPQREFCTFADLADAGHAFAASLQRLAKLVKQLPQGQRLPFHSMTLLNGTLATRLQQGKGNAQQIRLNREGLAYLIKANQGQAVIHPAVIDAITQLHALEISDAEMAALRDDVCQCYQQLVALVSAEDFTDRYSHCDFYTCEVLDKEAAFALVLGNAVSCCLATDGGNFAPEMINRLSHPGWVPVVVRDYKNDYVAAAWCAIAYDEETKQILFVEDFADIAPRFSQREMVQGVEIENRSGNFIMKELHTTIRNLARHLELEDGPLIGKQARGRMEKFDVFAKGEDAYFAKPKLAFLCNKQSAGDNIQHPGVVGEFFRTGGADQATA
jgi:hypothetical protein